MSHNEEKSTLNDVSRPEVAFKTDRRYSNLLWGVGGATLLFLTWWLSGSSTPKGDTKTIGSSYTDTRYQQTLEANLAELKKEIHSVEHSYDPEIHRPTYSTPKQDKAHIARQHAPTTLYQLEGRSTRQDQHSSSSHTLMNGSDVNSALANRTSRVTEVNATVLTRPDATIVAGELIHAVLESAIHSDLPGMVRAVVTSPVYAYTGELTLIPKGSRLIGQYATQVAQNQQRVMIVWQRAVLPSGISVQIDSPNTDIIGRAGLGADAVNRHFFARFGEASLLSIIGAGVATQNVGSEEQYNSASQYRSAVAHSFQESASASLSQTLSIKPTLTINQGALITVFVAHDIRFDDNSLARIKQHEIDTVSERRPDGWVK